MKPQPHDWTQLAAPKAARLARQGERMKAPSRAPVASSPAPARTTLLMVPLAATSACAWWLASGRGHSAPAALLGGAVALLLPLTLYLWHRVNILGAQCAAARREQLDILASLREGVFVFGRDLQLSGPCSASVSELLRVAMPAGRRLEDLLRPLLDDATLAAALTFLRLLWNERADLDAIESLNPLAEVQVSFADSRGGYERRYLSFSFRRIAGRAAAGDCIIGLVADVTDRVLLARELERAESAGDSQAELLLQLVRADPVALVAFLDDADAAFRKSNAILMAPGATAQQLQKKLIGVLRELDAVTRQAEALALASFAQRLQSIDDVLSGLCTRPALCGHDFLPLVVRLDELIEHAASMRSIQQHIVLMRAASAALAAFDERDALSTATRPAHALS